MQIDFNNYDLTNFLVKEGIFCGIPAKLITPNHIGTKFDQSNKIFRSSIWSLDGVLLSAAFKKFVNAGENPDNFPLPSSLDGTAIVDKIDGSLCCIDYINDTLSMRTRGTFSVDTAENVSDFYLCLDKYPKITEWLKNNPNYSLITEITTPNCRIVIRYGDDPDFWLTGVINKDDYSLMTQSDLDKLAVELGMKRPSSYTFTSISDLIDNVNKWVGKEGICLYSKDGQEIWKVKSADYCLKHRLKEEFGNIEKIIDFFIQCKCPQYQVFLEKISEVVDWETANEVRGDVSNICDAYKEVNKIVHGMQVFVDMVLSPLKTRREQAEKVLSSYGTTNRAAFVFKTLDKKPLGDDDLKKLLYQCLKNK